jgi:hypothetical protein
LTARVAVNSKKTFLQLFLTKEIPFVKVALDRVSVETFFAPIKVKISPKNAAVCAGLYTYI